MVAVSKLEALAANHREQGLQLGSQVFASLHGKPLVHFADGESMQGYLLTTSSVMRWYEAGMPLLALLAGRLIERDKLRLDDKVGDHLKHWANGKEACTVRHLLTHMGGLLTHMGGFAGAELGDRDITDAEALEQISAYRAEYQPGSRAGFHPTSGWRVLASIIESVERTNPTKLINRHIFRPLRLRGSAFTHLKPRLIERLGSTISQVHWCGYTTEARNDEGEITHVPHHRESIHNTTWHAQRWEPGLGTWGSAAALGRVYEGLLKGAPKIFERSTTIEFMTANHRNGVKDRTLHGAAVPWGLGFQVAGSFGGSVGYRAFGHSGMTGRAICDPVEGLVLVYLTNGLSSRVDNERRMAEMTDALYEACLPKSTGPWITTSLPAVGVT